MYVGYKIGLSSLQKTFASKPTNKLSLYLQKTTDWQSLCVSITSFVKHISCLCQVLLYYIEDGLALFFPMWHQVQIGITWEK